ncbi:FHA domain-containing protein [Candidatus Oscillochloris fontis]|uniref:FHA domain-containing protein n=1 Tax=Candidatus Oscillochloris fontis TaxID=2496868 RepID=UPI00101DCE98|nr:FHA domain-containing protein [Candidatus Oscillochloris fontis]
MNPASPSPPQRACPYCGTNQRLSAQFCAGCGRPLVLAWQLRLVQPPGTVVAIGAEPLVIGRRTESSLCINDPRVSRSHARIAWDGQGFLLADLGSSGGTYLNQIRLAAPDYIRPGDQIGLGNAVMVRVEEQSAPAVAAAPAPVRSAAPPPAAAPILPAASPKRRGLRGAGCVGALLLVTVLGVLALFTLVLPNVPISIPQFGFGATSDVAVPVMPPLPPASVEQPAIAQTLDDLAAALRSGDVEAAMAQFAPTVRDEYRTIFAAHPERLAAMAAPLERAQLSFLADYIAPEDGFRRAEVAVEVDGFTFAIGMVKVEGRWLVVVF